MRKIACLIMVVFACIVMGGCESNPAPAPLRAIPNPNPSGLIHMEDVKISSEYNFMLSVYEDINNGNIVYVAIGANGGISVDAVEKTKVSP